MPVDETLDKVFRNILITLLRIYNYTHAFCIVVWSHSTRICKAIQNEYKSEYYYFFKDSEIPYKSRGEISEETLPVDWVYDVSNKQYISVKDRSDTTPNKIHKFDFLCIDVKKEGNVDCVIGFFKDISWKGSDMPPNPSLLLRTYGLENGVILNLDGLELEIVTNRGLTVNIPVTDDGLERWKRLFQSDN